MGVFFVFVDVFHHEVDGFGAHVFDAGLVDAVIYDGIDLCPVVVQRDLRLDQSDGEHERLFVGAGGVMAMRTILVIAAVLK